MKILKGMPLIVGGREYKRYIYFPEVESILIQKNAPYVMWRKHWYLAEKIRPGVYSLVRQLDILESGTIEDELEEDRKPFVHGFSEVWQVTH